MSPRKKLPPKRPPRRGALMGMRSGFRRAVGASPGPKRSKPSFQKALAIVVGGVVILALVFGMTAL